MCVRVRVHVCVITPGGGGGTSICAYWVGAIFETPIFNPKFPLQCISFAQITEKSAPDHHHFRVVVAPETTIFKISYSRPEYASYKSAPETTNFTLEPAPETHLFTLKPLQIPTFSLRRGT